MFITAMIIGIGLIIYLFFWMTGKYLLKETTRAKKICTIYKTILSQNKPQMTDEDKLKLTTFIYFKSLKWDKETIEIYLKTLFENSKPNNIRELINAIFVYERPNEINLRSPKIYEQFDKTDRAIDKACKEILGENFNN